MLFVDFDLTTVWWKRLDEIHLHKHKGEIQQRKRTIRRRKSTEETSISIREINEVRRGTDKDPKNPGKCGTWVMRLHLSPHEYSTGFWLFQIL